MTPIEALIFDLRTMTHPLFRAPGLTEADITTIRQAANTLEQLKGHANENADR